MRSLSLFVSALQQGYHQAINHVKSSASKGTRSLRNRTYKVVVALDRSTPDPLPKPGFSLFAAFWEETKKMQQRKKGKKHY
jgi:hypothetical protein